MKTNLLAVVSLSLLAGACGGDKKPVAKPAPKVAVDPDAALIAEAKAFIQLTDRELMRLNVAAAEAEWAKQTDITDAPTLGLSQTEASDARKLPQRTQSLRYLHA